MTNDELRKKLELLSTYYITAKEHLLFSENYSNKTSIGVINELRYSFDHLIRAVVKDNENEIDKSINHLKRAAYDSCEIISIDAFKKYIKNYQSMILKPL